MTEIPMPWGRIWTSSCCLSPPLMCVEGGVVLSQVTGLMARGRGAPAALCDLDGAHGFLVNTESTWKLRGTVHPWGKVALWEGLGRVVCVMEDKAASQRVSCARLGQQGTAESTGKMSLPCLCWELYTCSHTAVLGLLWARPLHWREDPSPHSVGGKCPLCESQIRVPRKERDSLNKGRNHSAKEFEL